MKLIMLSLSLIPLLLSYADFDFENQNHIIINSQCSVNEPSRIFVLKALFANSENSYPIELWENRENQQMNIFDIARQIKSIVSSKEKVFDNSNESERTCLLARLSQMEDIADRALLMEADKWKADYVNELMKHIIGIRHAGISALFPSIVDPNNCEDVILDQESELDFDLLKKRNIFDPCDESGQHWTSISRLSNLNNEDSSIARYMQNCGTDIKIIKTWWMDQITSSWSKSCQAVKIFFSNQRTIEPKNYYWSQEGYNAAKDEYFNLWQNGQSYDDNLCYQGTFSEDSYIKAFIIWHAYVQEILSKIKFYHNNLDEKQVCLIRTTSVSSLKNNNITQFTKGNTMSSASYDSFTLVNIYNKGTVGGAIIDSLVPHHRIIHLYPLINEDVSKYVKDFEAQLIPLTNFILKTFYNENGVFIIDLNKPAAFVKAVEQFIFNVTMQKLPFEENIEMSEDLDTDFTNIEKMALEIISALPLKIKPESSSKAIQNFLMEKFDEENIYIYETEFLVLSGSDQPFDYFYNTDENLSQFEKRLDNGECVCGFWPSLDDLKQINNLESKIAPALYLDSKTGKKYVFNKDIASEYIYKDVIVDHLYEASGHKVLENRMYDTPEGLIKVSVYPENSQFLYNVYHNADEKEQQRLRNEISQGFVLDALLDNFQVVGSDMNNILIGDDRQIYRLHYGVSVEYESEDELNKHTLDESRKYWSPSPMIIWELRDPKINPNPALIFADVNIYELAGKIILLCPNEKPIEEDSEFSDGDKDEIEENEDDDEIEQEDDKNEKENHQNLNTFYSHTTLKNATELKMQLVLRFDNFIKVAFKALELKANGLTSEEADVELRKWAENENWEPNSN